MKNINTFKQKQLIYRQLAHRKTGDFNKNLP